MRWDLEGLVGVCMVVRGKTFNFLVEGKSRNEKVYWEGSRHGESFAVDDNVTVLGS